MTGKGSGFFWPSFTDLMTSLFFIMLVLYVLTYLKLTNQQRATEQQLREIKRVQEAVKALPPEYFIYDPFNQRYKLNLNVNFSSNSSNINDLNETVLDDLLEAGKSILSLLNQLNKTNSKVSYLLIIEGNTQRSFDNYLKMPDVGYKLSYQRALALVNYWQNNGLDFKEISNCELMIVGSGYFGKARETNEDENRKFTIQITPKIGEIKLE
ncbi:MAG: OmpA family protein [Bacteroidetes bacterium]|nr:OmpA family protein [Bacteroidota bacterium]